MSKKHVMITSLFVASLFLQGCMNVATTGAEVVYNRQNITKNLKDQYLTMQAYQALKIDTDEFNNANISISTYNREMLLAGEVPYAWQKAKAEKIVKQIEDVDRVYNLVVVKGPSSSLTRVSDSWITAKIKAKFLASNDLDATKIKVVTENGTVYLMGILLQSEADAAVDIARETDGVKKVIKIFSYMTISKKPQGSV